MAPTPACANPEPLTCEELQDIEVDNAESVFQRLCHGNAGINDLIQLFFMPPWATDAGDQREALLNYLTRHAICHPSNNKGTDCDDEEPCLDPQPTFCPDPDECPSKFVGYGLLEVIKSAIRADSMVRLPIKGLSTAVSGEPLVWDPTAVADNPDCDPCTPNVLGAWTPQHLYEIAHPGG